jgi:ABC-type transporter Mla maintaining outer membrane lipid asymmetry ATPase subunit MlaF
MEAVQPVIELRGCAVESAEDPGRPALPGVDWRILPGECWAVGGLPGSGKTLLLETAAGLRPAAAGEVRITGRAIEHLAEAEARALRRDVGFVYGDGGRLLSHLTVAQNVALPICYHRNCDAMDVADELTELLAAFGLTALARRLPGQVNAAFRQRTALARALALRPTVLFLDNPLGGLNTAHVRWWLEFLGGANLGWPCPATVITVTDDLRPWLAVARQFALIHDGRWQVLGGRENLAAAGEPLLRELLAESAPRA